MTYRRPQVCILGSAEPGSAAHALAGDAGGALASLGITVVSGCGSPATRFAAERAVQAGGRVLSIVPPGEMPPPDWPATVVVPCGMGDARNLLMALAGDACIVIGGRAGTKSEVHLAWMHRRPLLPLVGCGGWSDELPANPPDDRASSSILPWRTVDELTARLRDLGLVAQARPETKRGNYTITTDPRRIDTAAVHAYLARSYWAEGIPFAIVQRALRNSLCFALLHGEEQVGFARVVTDRATFAYLADVYVLEEHRGQGLSKWLLQVVQSHEDLQGLRRFLLATKDAHGLYEQFGFKPLLNPSRMMEVLDPDVYRRP